MKKLQFYKNWIFTSCCLLCTMRNFINTHNNQKKSRWCTTHIKFDKSEFINTMWITCIHTLEKFTPLSRSTIFESEHLLTQQKYIFSEGKSTTKIPPQKNACNNFPYIMRLSELFSNFRTCYEKFRSRFFYICVQTFFGLWLQNFTFLVFSFWTIRSELQCKLSLELAMSRSGHCNKISELTFVLEILVFDLLWDFLRSKTEIHHNCLLFCKTTSFSTKNDWKHIKICPIVSFCFVKEKQILKKILAVPWCENSQDRENYGTDEIF